MGCVLITSSTYVNTKRVQYERTASYPLVVGTTAADEWSDTSVDRYSLRCAPNKLVFVKSPAGGGAGQILWTLTP